METPEAKRNTVAQNRQQRAVMTSQKCKLAELLQNEWHAITQEENTLSSVACITFIIQCFMIVGFYFIINRGQHTHIPVQTLNTV
jgi:hypothetical protein